MEQAAAEERWRQMVVAARRATQMGMRGAEVRPGDWTALRKLLAVAVPRWQARRVKGDEVMSGTRVEAALRELQCVATRQVGRHVEAAEAGRRWVDRRWDGHARLAVMVWEWRQVVVRRKAGEAEPRADEVWPAKMLSTAAMTAAAQQGMEVVANGTLARAAVAEAAARAVAKAVSAWQAERHGRRREAETVVARAVGVGEGEVAAQAAEQLMTSGSGGAGGGEGETTGATDGSEDGASTGGGDEDGEGAETESRAAGMVHDMVARHSRARAHRVENGEMRGPRRGKGLHGRRAVTTVVGQGISVLGHRVRLCIAWFRHGAVRKRARQRWRWALEQVLEQGRDEGSQRPRTGGTPRVARGTGPRRRRACGGWALGRVTLQRVCGELRMLGRAPWAERAEEGGDGPAGR